MLQGTLAVSLFLTFIGRHVLRDAKRSATTVVGIALGIALVVAIRLANASSVGGFEAALDAVSGETSVEVVAAGGLVDETRLLGLDWLREWGLVSPVIDGDATVRGPDGADEAVRVLGVDILRDRPFREYRLLVDADRRELDTTEFLSVLTDDQALVLTEQYAERHALAVGSTVELVVGDRAHQYRVRGLLANEGPARIVDGNFALMDIAAAQVAFDRIGWLDRLDVRLHDPAAIDAAERAIASRLPAGLMVQRPERRGRQVEKMLAAFHFNLTALSYIALLVGLFLVYNTVTVSVISRREQIGMLRAVGATRACVLGLFLGEAAVLAVVGVALGVPLGWVLARGAVRLTSTTVNVLYVSTAAVVPPLDWTDVGLGAASGIPLALVAAALPALEAARTPPLDAVRGATRLEVQFRLPRRFLLAPAALFVVAAWLATRGPIGGLPVYGLAAALATIFGAALLVPALLVGLHRVSGGVLARWAGPEGVLAHANLGASIGRVAISVAALAVSLSMLVAIAVMIGSFRETVTYWVGQSLKADLYVAPARRSTLGTQPTISMETERQIASHPAVLAVDSFRSMNVPYGNGLIVVGAGGFDVLLEHGTLLFKAPRDGRPAMQAALGKEAVVVSESFALRFDQTVGDRIDLPTPDGPRAFQIAAVYYDYSSDRGIVVMDRRLFARHFGDVRPTGLTVYLREGASPEEVRAQLLAALPETSRVFIRTNGALRAEILRIFDATFSITYALEAIAVFVAMLGIAGTLVTLTLERRRDLTVLRLVGADHRQLGRLVVVEAVLLGLVSQAMGLVIGTLLSLILIYVINVQSFGWTIQFHLPVAFLVQTTVMVLAATAVAGVYPSRLARQFELADLTAGG